MFRFIRNSKTFLFLKLTLKGKLIHVSYKSDLCHKNSHFQIQKYAIRLLLFCNQKPCLRIFFKLCQPKVRKILFCKLKIETFKKQLLTSQVIYSQTTKIPQTQTRFFSSIHLKYGKIGFCSVSLAQDTLLRLSLLLVIAITTISPCYE